MTTERTAAANARANTSTKTIETDEDHEDVRWLAELKSMCHGWLHEAIFENREVVIQFAWDGKEVDIDDLSQVRGAVCSLNADAVVVVMRNGKSERIYLDWITDVFLERRLEQ